MSENVMKFNLGLKIGSKDTKYTDEILRFYEQGIFQYIELFTLTGTYEDTISYWKQFNISFGIHAPHSSVANGWIYLGKVRIDGYKKSTNIQLVDDKESNKFRVIITREDVSV